MTRKVYNGRGRVVSRKGRGIGKAKSKHKPKPNPVRVGRISKPVPSQFSNALNQAIVRTEAEDAEAISFLKQPDVLGRMADEFSKVIADEREKIELLILTGLGTGVKYAHPTSFKCFINDESRSGKDFVSGTICKTLFSWRVIDTGLTAQSFSYCFDEPNFTLDGRILRIGEVRADLVKSEIFKRVTGDLGEGEELTLRIPYKGRSKLCTVRGNCPLIMTSAGVKLDIEVAQRFSTLHMDSSPEHKKATRRAQARATRPQKLKKKVNPVCANAIAYLLKERREVDVPFAEAIAETWNRDLPVTLAAGPCFTRFVDYIKAHALASSLQRDMEEDVLISTLDDYEEVRRRFYNFLAGSTNFVPPSLGAISLKAAYAQLYGELKLDRMAEFKGFTPKELVSAKNEKGEAVYPNSLVQIYQDIEALIKSKDATVTHVKDERSVSDKPVMHIIIQPEKALIFPTKERVAEVWAEIRGLERPDEGLGKESGAYVAPYLATDTPQSAQNEPSEPLTPEYGIKGAPPEVKPKRKRGKLWRHALADKRRLQAEQQRYDAQKKLREARA